MEFLRKWDTNAFFLFLTVAFPLFAGEKNRGGFEGLNGILTSRRKEKGKERKLAKKKKVGMVELQSDINNNKVLMAGRRLK